MAPRVLPPLVHTHARKVLGEACTGGHEIASVAEAGWAGKKNGELLRLYKKEFDALVSTDKGEPHQQNLSRFDLAAVLLRASSNALEGVIA